MSTISNQTLARLKEQRDKLNARIQQRESILKQSQRKMDTRKKILIGSYYLEQATKDNKLDEIKSIMDQYLKRNSDRTLFDLKLLPQE